MKWSWKLGEIAGIGVYMHATFLLLIGWVGLSHWVEQRTIPAVASGVAFILALFGCVVLHELGHALTARKYGIQTRDITLLPIGGVARLERMPDDPRQELWVALAGPTVSIAVAIILFFLLLVGNALVPLHQLAVGRGSFIERLLAVNVFLAVFNMLPAFPMDGGRVLRALLATQMPYAQATQIAAGLGQGMAFLFGFLGFFTNPFLVFIALFIWIGAAEEAGAAQTRAALEGIMVRQAMLTDFHTLRPTDSLDRAVELMLASSQQDFPVKEGDAVIGMLTRVQLLVALSRQGPSTPVAEVMERTMVTVDAGDPLEQVFTQLQTQPLCCLPVTQQGQLVGLLTRENVGEFLMVQAALSQERQRGARTGSSAQVA